jgi:ribosome-binding factor A
MPREFSRASRIADQIQRDLSGLIRQEIKDPRVGLVTITAVDVTRDLSHAKIYVSSLADAAAAEQSVEALQHAAGFLRRQLGRTLKIRSIPQLQFLYDASVERGVRLSHLIDEAVASDSRLSSDDDTDDR